ncbi:hypothetical protein PBY51_017272 [Eleginops maclovinus]|uniref:Secreted protein n=1 Tax=Eleginops maclovinus TaxID=56733 RepID=A0AAN7XIP4_ELEMC|nr:hypothetical protein PBY51_017272 [Eleginops maclovinus]
MALCLWLSKLRVCKGRGGLAACLRNFWACRVRAGGGGCLSASHVNQCLPDTCGLADSEGPPEGSPQSFRKQVAAAALCG